MTSGQVRLFRQTASANANFVLGQSAGGVDDTGRVVPAHDLIGFHISDPTANGTKQKVLIAAGRSQRREPGKLRPARARRFSPG